MSKTIMATRRGSIFKVFSDEDLRAAKSFPDGVMLKLVVSGARKQRAYRELACYWGSCQYIADLALSEYMDSQAKVNHMTRVRLGFVDETFVDPKTGNVHFIPARLDYQNCDQAEAHEFIAKALAAHAELAGMDCTDDYIQLLKELK